MYAWGVSPRYGASQTSGSAEGATVARQEACKLQRPLAGSWIGGAPCLGLSQAHAWAAFGARARDRPQDTASRSPVVLVLFFLLAALPALAQAPASGHRCSQAPPAQDTPEANKAVVRHYLQILSGGALDELDQVIGPDFVDRTPGTAARHPGTRGDPRVAAPRPRAVPGHPLHRRRRAGRGGPRRRPLHGARDAEGGGGKPVEVLGITLFRLAGGKIRETWIVNDQIELFRQLGFTLRPPAEAPKPRHAAQALTRLQPALKSLLWVLLARPRADKSALRVTKDGTLSGKKCHSSR